MRRAAAGGHSLRELAKQFDVSHETIRAALQEDVDEDELPPYMTRIMPARTTYAHIEKGSFDNSAKWSIRQVHAGSGGQTIRIRPAEGRWQLCISNSCVYAGWTT